METNEEKREARRLAHQKQLYEAAFRSGIPVSTADSGQWVSNSYQQAYDINLSSVLTFLIQRAGAVCKQWASDLFITWGTVQRQLEEYDFGEKIILFGLRTQGVDSNSYVYSNMSQSFILGEDMIPNHYKELYALRLTTDGYWLKTELRNIYRSLTWWSDGEERGRDMTPMEIYKTMRTLELSGYPTTFNSGKDFPQLDLLFNPIMRRLEAAFPEGYPTTLHDYLERAERCIIEQEELLNNHTLEYISFDHPKKDTLEDAIAVWFQGNLGGNIFYRNEFNNSMLWTKIAMDNADVITETTRREISLL